MFKIEYKTGDEVQAKSYGLWQIGVFIAENNDRTFKIKIGKETFNLPYFDVKPNQPAYQKLEKTTFGHKPNNNNAKRL